MFVGLIEGGEYKKTGFSVLLSQFVALLIKNALFIKRGWMMYLIHVSINFLNRTILNKYVHLT